jgi:hypothetical protein
MDAEPAPEELIPGLESPPSSPNPLEQFVQRSACKKALSKLSGISDPNLFDFKTVTSEPLIVVEPRNDSVGIIRVSNTKRLATSAVHLIGQATPMVAAVYVPLCRAILADSRQ